MNVQVSVTDTNQATPAQLTDLINQGRFAEYHIAKAKIAVANKDYKSAKYEVEASICHGRTPEATALKAEIKRLAKGG
ncbi:MAG: hypothetical protein RLZ98_1854 [Pseudomonadota bacterium]|jgi:hypothetical protein